jgi:hypothetical protein
MAVLRIVARLQDTGQRQHDRIRTLHLGSKCGRVCPLLMHSKDPNVRDVGSLRPGNIVFPQRLISRGIPAARILRRRLPRTGLAYLQTPRSGIR